jgi:glycosyltransferase involved in cell wall biosynthesis
MAQDSIDTPTPSHRIAIVGPDAWSMIRLREGLIRSLVARRHRVLCVCPTPTPAESEALKKLGAEVAAWSPRSGPFDILAHRRSIDELARILSDRRPYAVVGYGPMPMLIAPLAGRRAGAGRVVPMISSLAGFPRQEAAIGWALKWLARSALRAADAVICHNATDAQLLTTLRLLPARIPVHVVPGGGVDLEHFAFAPLPPADRGLVFAMVARLTRDKGVLEFCAAAKRVRARSDKTRLILAGPPGPAPEGLSLAEVAAASEGAVELLGEVEDVRPTLASAHVFVLASHVEGMPRAVLEALATGRPVITSDIPGARDTVDERVNGVLVPPGDVDALVRAMESFLKRPDLIASMARASRHKAERRFSAAEVNAALHRVLMPSLAAGRVA